MSRARRLRRQANRLAERRRRDSAASPSVDVVDHGDNVYETLVMADGATFTVPRIPPDAPAELQAALVRRRQAHLTGRCQCGARVHASPGPAGLIVWSCAHRSDCPADDEALLKLAHELGWEPK